MARFQRIRGSLRRRRQDERGATLIFTAISMVALLGAGAMGVDVGFSVEGSRQAQAMADTAALDMARYINVADTQSDPQLFLNGKLPQVTSDNSSNAGLSVTPGLWLNGAWSIPATCAPLTPPAAHPCNAVKVTATQAVPQIFFGGFNTLAARSTIAAVTPESGFSIGSYLVNFNSQQSAVLNAILSPLGDTVNLTAVGYPGLANTFVTVGQLVTASGGLLTTSNVMTVSLTGSQWLAIWRDAVANQVAQLNCGSSPTPNPCNATTALSALDFSGSTSAQLCQLVSVNGSSCANGSLSTPALSANLDALQMLTTEAELANGTSALNVTSALNITGVTSAQLYLTLIQPPQVAFGPVGTPAQTAQLQADLKLSVLGAGLLDIPLTAASATATVKTINCAYNTMSSTKYAVTSTTATGAVTLAGLGIANLSISGYSGPQISFIGANVPPTASTEEATPPTNPITVSSNTTPPYYPSLNYSGLSPLSPVFTLLTSTLSGVLPEVLQASGVSVGGAQTADLSTTCGAVSLVQ